MNFSLTAVTVLTLMAFAVPGYLLIRFKAVKEEGISYFAKLLLFVCQPCLSLYSFNKADYSRELFADMSLFFALSALLEAVMLGALFLIFRKRYANPSLRVVTVAAAFGNVGFLGVPLLEALLPDHPDAVAFSAVFIVAMNLMAWTLGSTLLTGDKKYISLKKLLLNPPVLILFVALPLFFTGTKLPSAVDNFVTLLARMTTPLCMIILGMRLATVSPKELFSSYESYLTAALKLVAFPFIAYLLVVFLPVEEYVKQVMFILACCPTASVVLNLAEIYGVGQKPAAFSVLTSTIFSMITIPLLLLIL